MKNNKLDSVVFMWIGFALAILAVLMMFVPVYKIEGQIYNAVNGFFGSYTEVGSWPTFVGYMLILVGGLLTAYVALPFFEPSYSGEKLLLIIASVLEAVGIALVMCAVVWYCLLNGQPELITHSGYYPLAGAYITGSLSLLAIACNAYALHLDR